MQYITKQKYPVTTDKQTYYPKNSITLKQLIFPPHRHRQDQSAHDR